MQFSTGDTDEFNKSHITLKKDSDNVEDAILVIEHAVLEDRNFYNCTARNKATELGKYEQAEDGSYVRVKGMLNIEFSDFIQKKH